MSLKGALPMDKPPSSPAPHLTFQFIKFTFYNDLFSAQAITCKHTKYDTLVPQLQQLGWNTLPPLILRMGIRSIFHKSSIDILKDGEIPTP